MIEIVHYVARPGGDTALCGQAITDGVWSRHVSLAGKPFDEGHELCPACDTVFQQG